MKIAVTAAILAIAPLMAFGQGCNWMKDQTASISCAEGTTYDPSTGTCVAEVIG